ncbi:MAG: transposase domain-containing protein [Culicoidibacterales bacterium]
MTEMVEYLKEQNKELTKNFDELTTQNKLLMKHIDQLTEQIAVMNQRFFGRKSEKCIPENQTSLFDDYLTPEESVLLAKIEAESTPKSRVKTRKP